MKFKALAYAVGVGCGTLPITEMGFAQEPAPGSQGVTEEVVVTGSYIRRDNFDSSSPLTVVDAAAISDNATPNLGEVLVAQTFNYGSDFQTNTYAARAQGGLNTQANLRGLGARATLDLIDGKRAATGNLNNALPQIAIERIDILKDGASALYGSDAVAGVVNIVTNKDFEGTRLNLFTNQADGIDEQQAEFMIGTPTDTGHFTMALSWAERGELQQIERPTYLREGFERSGTGNPGDWLVPNRDATGALTGTASRMADPGCGVEHGSGGTDVGVPFSWASGDPNGSRTNCRLHFGKSWNYINPQKKYSLWSNFRYDFNDNLSNDFDFIGSRLDTDSRGSPQNPGGRTEEFPIVSGDHPGNPWRAMADRGNGLEPLFAQDANGDGIPDRGTADINGDGLPDVILSPTPFDPTSGIPFNEDVDVVALRILGFLGTLPGVNNPSVIDPDGANTGNATFNTTNYRISDTLTWDVPGSSWEITGNMIASRGQLVTDQKNSSQSALIAGLQGQLKATPTDATTSYWNPFSTQAFDCVNRVCTYDGTPGFANTVDVLNAINIRDDNVTDTKFYSAEVVATGELFDIGNATVSGAFGAQFRRDEIDVDINAAENRCDWHQGGCGFDYSARQDVDTVFFEFVAPFDSIEVQLAGAYTDYGGGIGDSFDPKLALLWQPLDRLSFRASFSSAFIAPDLDDLFEPEDCGLQTANDPLTQDFSQSFRVACVSGNPNLAPETADVGNIGMSLSLLEGNLDIGIDYSVYDFEDRITQTTLNQVVTTDYENFLAAGGDVNDPMSVQAWIDGPNSDPNILRDTTGVLTRVITRRLNAQQMEHKAWDLYTRYSLDLDRMGSFRFGLDASYVQEYSYDLGFGIPPADGAGSQNESVAAVPPMPEWRVTSSVNWFKGNHRVMLRARWTDEFDLSFNSAALQGFHAFVNGFTVMPSITYLDMNYSYTTENARPTTFEIGGRNINDKFPPSLLNLGGIETFVHDIRGATWYLRINQQF